MKKNVKGITLIALVVTIIVLLILAGIAINLIIGNNGLFSRAKNAANTWKQAEANEAGEMKNFENVYDETLNNIELGGNSEETKKSLSEITGKEKTNTDTTDKAGNRIVVPAGFKVINPNDTVNEGIVIEDVEANNENTVGNQFVWIPCTLDGANGSIKYDRYAFARDDWSARQKKEGFAIIREDATNYYYSETLAVDERQSIEMYEGYYIGRYEVGTDVARNYSSQGKTTDIAKIKQNLSIYNVVTIDEAKELSEGMYIGKSRLCSSYAWDTALQFIGGTYAVDSTGDNYTGKLENAGYHAEKNIYDMGGNVFEWTTEKLSLTSHPYVPRRRM